MKKVAAIILISLSVTTKGFTQLKENILKQAYIFFDGNKYELSLKELNDIIEKDSSIADAFDLRGEVYYKLAKIKESLADYTMAIHLSPEDPYYYHHRAIVLYATQNPDLAISDNNKALRFTSNDSLKFVIIANRGSCKTMKRDFQGAYDDLMIALQFDSTNQGVLSNLGAILDDLNRSEEAIYYLEKVIKLYPDFVGGYANLAFRYLDKGDYKKALELNNKVLALDPSEPLGYNNRGFVKYKLNDLPGALADINKSLELYATNSYAFKNRALVYIALSDYVNACKDIQNALKYGFTCMYGDEVNELNKNYCTKL